MYIAIDIGGTKTRVAAYSTEGEILRSEKHPTEKDFGKFIKNLISEVKKVAGEDSIEAIGVAAPALIDYETDVAKSFGNLDWKDVDIVGPLKHEFTDKVFIDNDANMGALGESNMGAGNNYEIVLYVTLSTGIGTGVTYKGEISDELRRSEGGQMRFRHDGELMIWEKFASGKAFFEKYGIYGEDDDNPEHWKEWAEDVSLGLNDLSAVIQPNIIVLGGSMGVHIEKYHHFLQDSLQKKRGATMEMPIVAGAKYPDLAVINGCFIACRQHLQA